MNIENALSNGVRGFSFLKKKLKPRKRFRFVNPSKKRQSVGLHFLLLIRIKNLHLELNRLHHIR
jgi:hypothetical protein